MSCQQIWLSTPIFPPNQPTIRIFDDATTALDGFAYPETAPTTC
jgi:hypothetical protein